jgi:hypothetical protein
MTRALRATALCSAAVVALAAAPVADAKPKPKPTCTPKKSKTVVANSQVRVYRRAVKVSGSTAKATFACLYSKPRPIRFPLDPDFPEESTFSPIALSGHFVAFAGVQPCAACADSATFIYVIDVKKHGFVATFLDDDGDDLGLGVKALVLKPNGSLAFSLENNGAPVAIAKWEHGTANPVMLDKGPDIAMESLALAGSTLYWMTAGVVKTAPLS